MKIATFCLHSTVFTFLLNDCVSYTEHFAFVTLSLFTIILFTQTPAGSPMVNGTSSPPESGVGTSLSSTTPSPRPGEDSSTARLLRHLQGRVQQLRAQNDSLRKSSENESLNDSHCSVMSTESVRYLVTHYQRSHCAHFDWMFKSFALTKK